MRWFLSLALGCLLLSPLSAQQEYKLAPAVAVEAEDFQIDSGWKVIRNGHGNYMVDIVGSSHISGERLLGIDEKDTTASAFHDVTLPEAGDYRLWVRYEYPPFCETRFRIVLQQDGKDVLDRVMGAKDSERYAIGEKFARPQYDPPSGPEGLVLEAVTVPGLKAGKARLWLRAAAQPQTPGVVAHRNIDLLYLTRDTRDDWQRQYGKINNLYPILDAVRDSRGARYEARFTNRGKQPAGIQISYPYNRIPWSVSESAPIASLAPGATSPWIPLKAQDTAHFSMVRFAGSGQPLAVDIRPVGGAVERRLSGPSPLMVYLPPYPGKGEKPITPVEEIDAILAELKRTPAIGKKPTQPLCFGGWMPLGVPSDYGRKYAELYAALGFRSLHPALSGPAVLDNLEAVGIAPARTWAATEYRNPPLPGNIERARAVLGRNRMKPYLRFYDYGDEVAFSEWVQTYLEQQETRSRLEGKPPLVGQALLNKLWVEWLKANRPTARLGDYWLDKWGPFHVARLQPDSSAEAAQLRPRLYVDSLLFYEEKTIQMVARGARQVRAELGADVLCGANYSCHPFYYPHSTATITWFRRGAAEVGRHSEYFWQAGQPGPMVNGYIDEHFRAGMRDNPRAVLRQYTMPHSPANTDASLLRSAFTHLAHGATMLDFFGVGMNETFTENHIDHRDHARYRTLRDVTHAVGFVEDLLPESRAIPSPVALLVSASTEHWDLAGIARDRAGHDAFGPDFRKTRLNAHLDRLGIWTALTFLGASPDLVMEEDVTEEGLKNYRVLVVVGDCLPPAMAPALEAWVRKGGVLLATANAGRYDPYRTPSDDLSRLFGLESRDTEERITFIRPRQELPFLKPLATLEGWEAGWHMPQLATREKLKPARDAEVLAIFADDRSPAILERHLGKGRVVYVAALPGVAYLWSALQPPQVPDRGPGTHSVPTAFDPGARRLFEKVLEAATVTPVVQANPPLVDTRLLKAPSGYLLPLANYHDKVGQKVTLTVQLDAPIRKASSAYHGKLDMKKTKEGLVITLPSLGYGDVVRLDP
jgi:hypothetical protein